MGGYSQNLLPTGLDPEDLIKRPYDPERARRAAAILAGTWPDVPPGAMPPKPAGPAGDDYWKPWAQSTENLTGKAYGERYPELIGTMNPLTGEPIPGNREEQPPPIEPFTLSQGQTRYSTGFDASGKPMVQPIASSAPASAEMNQYQQAQIALAQERNQMAREAAQAAAGKAAAGGSMKPSDYRGILTEVRTFANQAINSGDPNYIRDETGAPIGIEGIMGRVLQRDYGMTLEEVRRGAAMKEVEPAQETKPAVAPVSTPETRAARQTLENVGKRVVVANAAGKKFWLPATQLDEALRQGYRKVQ